MTSLSSCQELPSGEEDRGPDTLRPSGVFPTPPPAIGGTSQRGPQSGRRSRAVLQTLDGFIEPEAAPPSGALNEPPGRDVASAVVEAALGIAGAFACAVVSLDGATVLQSQCKRSDFDVDLFATHYARSAVLESGVLRRAGGDPSIGEFAVSLRDQVHLAIPLDASKEALVFVAVDRTLGHLNLTRLSLLAILARTRPSNPRRLASC